MAYMCMYMWSHVDCEQPLKDTKIKVHSYVHTYRTATTRCIKQAHIT